VWCSTRYHPVDHSFRRLQMLSQNLQQLQAGYSGFHLSHSHQRVSCRCIDLQKKLSPSKPFWVYINQTTAVKSLSFVLLLEIEG
jgi:hypothetical protein